MIDDASEAALREKLAQDSATGGCYLNRYTALMELEELNNPASVESRHAQFLRFCGHAIDGYAGMTDQQIAAAIETPALMNFFISALRSYRGGGDLEQTTTAGRNARLAQAFGLTGERGGDQQSHWTLDRQRCAVKAYADTLHSFGAGGGAERDAEPAQQAAVSAAYEAIFGPSYNHERRQMGRNLKGLLRILVDQGYLRPGDFTAKSK